MGLQWGSDEAASNRLRVATCDCPETDCTSAKHPSGKPCTSMPITIYQHEVLAGWSGGVCPECAPSVVLAVRQGRAISENALKRVFGPDYEPKKRNIQ